jgi:hypothetical protein
MALYQTIGVGESKQVEVGTGLQLKVMWRDSSRNHFFSKSKEGEFLFIERMEAPITEDEMREAYEQVEDYE